MTTSALPILHGGAVSYPDQRLQRVLSAVAHAAGVPVESLKLRSNRPEIAQPRQAAMWLMRRAYGWSLSRIARICGWYHHTTVRHALAAVEARRHANAEYSAVLDQLLAGLSRTSESENA